MRFDREILRKGHSTVRFPRSLGKFFSSLSTDCTWVLRKLAFFGVDGVPGGALDFEMGGGVCRTLGLKNGFGAKIALG